MLGNINPCQTRNLSCELDLTQICIGDDIELLAPEFGLKFIHIVGSRTEDVLKESENHRDIKKVAYPLKENENYLI